MDIQTYEQAQLLRINITELENSLNNLDILRKSENPGETLVNGAVCQAFNVLRRLSPNSFNDAVQGLYYLINEQSVKTNIEFDML
jgi:hypothetical protein